MNQQLSTLLTSLKETVPGGFICYQQAGTREIPSGLTFQFANEELYYSIGYSEEELRENGYQIYRFVAVEDRKKVLRHICTSISNPSKVEVFVCVINNPMGEQQHISARLVTIVDEDSGEKYLIASLFNLEFFYKTQKNLFELADQKQAGITKQNFIRNLPGDVAMLRVTESQIQLTDLNAGCMETMNVSWKQFQDAGGFLAIRFPEKEEEHLRGILEKAEQNQDKKQPAETCELRVLDGAGQLKWLEGRFSFLEKRNGYPYFLVAFWDIDMRKHMEEKLQIQAEQYKMMEDLMESFLFNYDVATHEIVIPGQLVLRKAFTRNAADSYPLDEILSIVHKDDVDLLREHVKITEDKPMAGVIEVRLNMSPEGEEPVYEWKRLYYKSIVGMYGSVIRVVGRCMDITDEKLERDELKNEIEKDPMTGLLNKIATETKIQEALTEDQDGTHALLLIDIDDFKCVNDTFGHLYGDHIISSIASNIRMQFRNTDIVGRIGGDEFLILMKNVTRELAITTAESICKAVSSVLHSDLVDLPVSCSIGGAVYPDNGTEYKELFKMAELSMYRIKSKGKNSVLFARKWEPNVSETNSFVSHRISDYGIVKQMNSEFTAYCFNLLAETSDINAAIDLIIKRIGEINDLGAVALFEFDHANGNVNRTNIWSKQKGISVLPHKSFHSLDWLLSAFDETGICGLNDCQNFLQKEREKDREKEREKNKENVKEEEQDTEKTFYGRGEQIQAVCYVRFGGNVNQEGCLAFEDFEKPRIWTSDEKEAYREIAHLLSIFVQLRKQNDNDRKIINQLKNRDHLTELLTEEAFIEKVGEREKKAGKKIKVFAYADIDGFSYVNENFGSQAGNQLLKEFVKIVQREDASLLFCRIFSDFFAAYAETDTLEQAKKMFVRIERNFAKKAREYYPGGSLRLSQGLYMMDEPNVTIQTAIENANLARKVAKRRGPGLLQVYDKQMRIQKNYDQMVAGEFHQALEEGRIEVFLQPKFLLEGYDVYGAEALARWRETDGSIRLPKDFIPQLEHIGYITELDLYVYEQILRRLKLWKREGLRMIPISVNFSKRHFDTDGFAENIQRMADSYEVDHKFIEIELTESLLAQRHGAVIREMAQLRENGFRVAIDDFGTGYSSLSMLMDIPADVVKIDKSFLQQKESEKQKRFIKTLGELVRSTREELICEGIETQEQVDFLKECGFHFGQGYVIDEPLRIDIFEAKYCEYRKKL